MSERQFVRRLEEHEEVQGMPALERFDARLADAAKKLQALGKWEAVVQRGGSSEHGLSLASSQFDAEVRACLTSTVCRVRMPTL